MVSKIRRFIRRIKNFLGVSNMGGWEIINGELNTVIDSLNRFILYNFKDKKDRKRKKVILFPLFEAEFKQNIWVEFLGKLEKNLKSKRNKSNSLFKNANAILFYTAEEIPRGDFPNSVYNQSRMLRNFFENTTYARTANYRNIIDKLKELIVEIKKNKKSLTAAIIDLETLTDNIPNFSSSKPTLKELSNIYTYQSFHTRIVHGNLREFKKFLEEGNFSDVNKLDSFKNNYYLARKKHDIASIISVNPLRFNCIHNPLRILVIDDNPDIEQDLKEIIPFLPKNTEIWLTESNEYKKFIYKPDFIHSLYKCKGELNLKKIDNKSQTSLELTTLFDNGNRFNFDYVIVDLLLGDYNEGNKIIRQLVKLRDHLGYEKAHFYILALSLSDDVDDITRSFEEGSLGYVWKFNRIYHLPYLIGELEESRQEIKKGVGITVSHAKARNFEKIYHLPPRIQMKLRTEPLLPICTDNGKNFHPFAKDVAKTWVKQMPKADLHYHLGGSMDENIIFYLAVNSLCHILKENGTEKIEEVCEGIKNIKRLKSNSNSDFYDAFFKGNDIYDQMKKIKEGGNLTDKNNKNNDFWKFLVSEFSGSEGKYIKYIEKNFDKPAEVYFDYLSWRCNMSKDDIITLFIVLVGLLEGRTIDEAKSFWCELNGKIKEFDCLNFDPPILKPENINTCKEFAELKNKLKNLSKSDFLSSLIRAPSEAKSLKEMFRGDCFIGALHLQYYENIIACVWYLVEKAVEENIRYLEMRVAPSGYTKKGLTLYQAVRALIDGANLSSLYFYLFEHKFIWTNFIMSLKRHKTPYERVQEIASAIMFRETEFEKLREKLREKLKVNNSFHPTPYEWQPSKVVAVDLTGYEKGYPPSEFLEDFSPIFKVCSYITIHAGEEETSQAIWEAIFKLNANRIGHGLTIHEFKELMNLARDTQICLELCPSSNIMTNFSGNPERYPLFKYVKEGLNVTINTDDRGTLGTTLSDEFVKAAELYYLSKDNNNSGSKIPLTKWETLRLIKAGFDSAFINREEKRKLLRWVEEEIYEKILQLYEIEPVYPVDKI